MTLLKCIVVCLALANAGYFLWLDGIAKSPPLPAATAASTLKLASEAPVPVAATPSDGADAESVGLPVASSNDPAGLMTTVKRCITVGPFKDVSEAAHAASTLRGGGYDPRQRVVDGDVWAGVWVYLPMSAVHPASEPVLAKLKAAGIDDALEMPGPADASVISLGLFSEQKRAQARVSQVQALGFNPTIADRKRTGNVYWIDIDLKPTEGLLNPADLQGDNGHINRLEVKACPAATPTAAGTPAATGAAAAQP